MWDGISDFDSASSIADFVADCDHILETSNEYEREAPLQETRYQTDTRSEATIDLSKIDALSREKRAPKPRLGKLASSDDFLEINQRFVARHF
jgi:hypothetical protein